MEDFLHPNHSLTMARRLWFHGFLAGLGVVLMILMAWILIRGTCSRGTNETGGSIISALPTQLPQALQSQPGLTEAVQAPSSPDTTAVLRTHIEKVLVRLKEANLNKDLDQVLALYSANSPERVQRTEEIAGSWKAFNYPAMTFALQEVKPLAPDRVLARVTWNIEAENRTTRGLKKITKTYQVWFINESGEWRIQAVEKGG